MAAVAGVADIGTLTLRELVWRHEAAQKSAWDHTALLALCVSRGPLVGRLTLGDFHPFLESSKPPPPLPENFPAQLTESEIMERWTQAKAKVHG